MKLDIENPVVTVTIKILDVRIGDKKILKPSSIHQKGSIKVENIIPHQDPIEFRFATIDEEIILKFAILQDQDLMGFIYLEIPQRFKKIKKFIIDDWFPVK